MGWNQNEKNLDLILVIENIRNGDKQAYVTIVERFQRSIYLYCYYLLRNQEEAEDAAQETFLKAYMNMGKYLPTHSFSAWLYKIAKNTCLDMLKKRSKDHKMMDNYRNQMNEQKLSQHIEFIYECLDKLKAEERQILLLRSLEEYSYEDIAFILDSKPATIRKKYERIRKKLIKGKKQGVGVYEHSY